MSREVVVLIIVHRPRLEWHEVVSLEQCFRILHNHPIFLLCPEGMDISAYRKIAPGLKADFIPARWLASYGAFARLKILPFLYRRYAKFDYILFYELDALVFRDELSDWCREGWDYIGAPWFTGHHDATPEAAPIGAGNGGFCLRRTQAMLRVLRSWGHVIPLKTVFAEFCRARSYSPGSLWLLVRRMTYRNNFFAPFNDFGGGEDIFWGLFAARRFPWLRVAPYDVARRFSFEVNAPRLYREIGRRLPFGCHKWQRLSPEFWFPIVEGLGYALPTEHRSQSSAGPGT